MSSPISLDAILDAAEAIVSESGAIHMTLDNVAERAGISKGGLMYRFPTKMALLQGMVGRQIARIEEIREQFRQKLSGSNPTELMIEIKTLLELENMDSRPSTALLAVVANQPELVEPFREQLQKRFSERILSDKNPARSTILILAALGLHFTSLLNVPFLEREQKKEVIGELLRLASDETAPL